MNPISIPYKPPYFSNGAPSCKNDHGMAWLPPPPRRWPRSYRSPAWSGTPTGDRATERNGAELEMEGRNSRFMVIDMGFIWD